MKICYNFPLLISLFFVKGTESVEGMMLISSPHEEENLNAGTFSMMKKLSFLKIYNVQLPQGLNYLSNELRLMEWHGYPLKFMPMSFQPKKLVELIMPHSHIKQLPEGLSVRFHLCKYFF